MTPGLPYEPSSPIPAGDTLAEWLELTGMRQSQFARRAGLSAKHVNQVVSGVASLSPEVALSFERVTSIPARYWNQLEANYQSARQELRETDVLSEQVHLLDSFPVRPLQKLGHLPQAGTPVDLLRALLGFFAVATPDALEAVVLEPAMLRRSPMFTPDDGAVASWLRIAELRAAGIATQRFDRQGCLDSLSDIRRLTRYPGTSWVQPLIDLCASFGIALVILKELPGCRLNGATRWLTQNKAMIVMSLRHKRNDIFWFTLFHELCHVLRHGKKRTFVDAATTDIEGDLEAEADAFAARQLIPHDASSLLDQVHTAQDAIDLAEQLGIAPGIVVGRMRYEGRIPHSRWTNLIDYYTFGDD